MLKSERKSQPQDPGSKSEPGAPSAFVWLVNERKSSRPVVTVGYPGHPPKLVKLRCLLGFFYFVGDDRELGERGVAEGCGDGAVGGVAAGGH
jgi:hypothetical protein